MARDAISVDPDGDEILMLSTIAYRARRASTNRRARPSAAERAVVAGERTSESHAAMRSCNSRVCAAATAGVSR